MNTYKLMERVFYDQCDVHEDTVEVKAKTGGNVIQNPSDPDATYDGHKGPGYQAQIAEACNPENDVQLITSVIPQTAVESDSNAVLPVLEDLKESDLLPESMLGDTLYAGDENVQLSEQYGVELVGPVPSGPKENQGANELNVDDFNIGQISEKVICCPAGHSPKSSVHNNQTGKTRTVMPESACGQCGYVDQCPVKKNRNGYCLDHTAKDRRLAARCHEECTDIFQQRYRLRGGLEGTNSGLKRRTGLGQLRVRGKPRVSHAIYLKIAGWNILRASVCAKIRDIVYERANAAIFDLQRTILQPKFAREVHQRGPRNIFSPTLRRFAKILQFQAAA
ncbi:MAG: transposase [Desulfobulbaceae bacterium]|nr:transposase [Desulfobulbaceae bacterium]